MYRACGEGGDCSKTPRKSVPPLKVSATLRSIFSASAKLISKTMDSTCSFVLSVFASVEQNPIWQLRPPMDGVVSAAWDLDVTHQISLIPQVVVQVPVRLDEKWASGSWPRFLRTNVDEKTQSGPRRILDLLREPAWLRHRQATAAPSPSRSSDACPCAAKPCHTVPPASATAGSRWVARSSSAARRRKCCRTPRCNQRRGAK